MSRGRRDAILLGTLWGTITGLNMLWTAMNTRPPHWDRANHLANSLVYLDLFTPAHLGDWLLTYAYYPPLAYWISDVFYAVFRTTDAWVAVLSQSIFLAILVGATYAIGRHLWSSRAGLLAALLVATAPMLVSGFKDYMLDAPLAAMAALALYLLIRSDSFARPWPTLLFGVACGLGLLTKWTFAFAIAVPAIVAATIALAQALSQRSWRPAAPLAAATALVLAIAGPWYLANSSSLVGKAVALSACSGCGWSAQIEGEPPLLTLRSLLWYAWDLVSLQLFLVPFVLFLVGIAFVIRDPAAARRNVYPLLLFGGTYLSQTILVFKDPRYSLPLIAGVAVLASYWVDRLRPAARAAVTAGIVAYCAGTFLAMSFGAAFLPRAIEVRLAPSSLISELPDFTPAGDFVSFRGLRIWSQQGYPFGQPSRERWYQEELFQIVARESPTRTLWFRGPDVDTIWFNDQAMGYYAKRYDVRLVSDPAGATVAAIRTLATERQADPPSGFTQFEAFTLPDESRLIIYARR